MCVIIHKPDNVTIKRRDFDNMWQQNPDGLGVAYYNRNKRLIVKKGYMDKDSAWKLLNSLQQQELIVHFRFATHGLVNEYQTHPFIISRDSREVKGLVSSKIQSALVHNGVIHGYGTETLSDTIHFIVKTLSRCEPTELKLDVLELIGDKFALLEHGKIHLVGYFQEYKGLLCSNLHWHKEPKKHTSSGNILWEKSSVKAKPNATWLMTPDPVLDGFVTQDEWNKLKADEREELMLEYNYWLDSNINPDKWNL